MSKKIKTIVHPLEQSEHAYGVETVELLFNENEILSLFQTGGFKLVRSLEFLQIKMQIGMT